MKTALKIAAVLVIACAPGVIAGTVADPVVERGDPEMSCNESIERMLGAITALEGSGVQVYRNPVVCELWHSCINECDMSENPRVLGLLQAMCADGTKL